MTPLIQQYLWAAVTVIVGVGMYYRDRGKK